MVLSLYITSCIFYAAGAVFQFFKCVYFAFPIPKKSNAKECSNYHTIALISHASKVILNILQARLQQYIIRELPEVQAVLEKAEEPEIKLLSSTGSSKKQESSRETSISAILTMPKLLTVWIIINCGKFWEMGIPDHLTCLLRNMYAGQEAIELDMEQQTGSKWEKEYVKALHCHPAYLNSMQSTSGETLGWIKHKL